MKNKILRYAYPLALALLATAAALFFATKPGKPAQLAAEYLQPEQEKSGALIGRFEIFGFAGPQTRTDSLGAALDLYQKQQYPAAEKAFRQYLGAYSRDSTAQFYLALSLLYQEVYPEAVGLLSNLVDLERFNLRNDARWYAAMAMTNVNPRAATDLFERISADTGSPYQQAAAAVLTATRLQPGRCTFEVQKRGAGNTWTTSLVMVVHPAWWQSWPARAVLLLLCAGGAAGILFWRKNERRKMQAKIEQAVDVRTQSLRLQKEQIQKEKDLSEELLLNILPAETAEELKKYGHSDTRRYEMVTVLFCDFQEFTRISEHLSPEELVVSLRECFESYDRIMTKQGLEKIKTVGDCYICAGGLTAQRDDEALRVVHAAQEMLSFLKDFNARQSAAGKPAFEARIGIHTGPVVAGIVGIKKFAYDIWGDTVNIAARMEQSSQGGRINLSGFTYELVKSHFACTYRGKIEAKGKGAVDMCFVDN